MRSIECLTWCVMVGGWKRHLDLDLSVNRIYGTIRDRKCLTFCALLRMQCLLGATFWRQRRNILLVIFTKLREGFVFIHFIQPLPQSVGHPHGKCSQDDSLRPDTRVNYVEGQWHPFGAILDVINPITHEAKPASHSCGVKGSKQWLDMSWSPLKDWLT